MEKIHEITAIAKNKSRKRVGRGSSSGSGNTSGRGNNGQKSRSGGSIPAYFEGGQTPWMMRLKKKKGFKPHRKFKIFRINLADLLVFAPEGEFSFDSLMETKRVEPNTKVKILGSGEVSKAYNVKTHFISKAAQDKIEAAGGTVTILS